MVINCTERSQISEGNCVIPWFVQSVVRKEASQQGFDINNVEVREGEDYFCKPAHLVITNTIDAETKSELLTALEQIKFTQLDLTVINLSGKGKGLAFFFKKCFTHITFVMSIAYSSRWNSSRSRIVSNIIILYLCLLTELWRLFRSGFDSCGRAPFQ